jgi:thiosulfate/3-mercaptopyruvate sulfurtransferase
MDWFSIKNEDHIVVYGQKGCPFLFRAYVQIFAMGHNVDRLHFLDGSLQNWIDAAGPVDSGPVQTVYAKDLLNNASTSPPSYNAVPARNVVDMEEIKRLASRAGSGVETTIVVDVRSPDRFYGRVDEPRPGLRRGHLPGSINLFFQDLLDPKEPAKLRPTEELRRLIQEKVPLVKEAVDKKDESRVVSLCGSGATACILATALLDIGVDPKRVWIYDGSWAEWGADPDVPIVSNKEEEA